jgi:hypothetical protein
MVKCQLCAEQREKPGAHAKDRWPSWPRNLRCSLPSRQCVLLCVCHLFVSLLHGGSFGDTLTQCRFERRDTEKWRYRGLSVLWQSVWADCTEGSYRVRRVEVCTYFDSVPVFQFTLRRPRLVHLEM